MGAINKGINRTKFKDKANELEAVKFKDKANELEAVNKGTSRIGLATTLDLFQPGETCNLGAINKGINRTEFKGNANELEAVNKGTSRIGLATTIDLFQPGGTFPVDFATKWVQAPPCRAHSDHCNRSS